MATAAATRNARMNPLMRLSRIDRDSEGFAEACEDTVYRLRVRPANHGDEIVHGIDPDEIAAGAAGAEALRRRARIGLRPRVQHPHEAVVRVERRRRDRLRDTALRHQLAIATAPLPKHEEAEPRVVAGVHEHAAAPMPAARHRLHPLAVDLDVGIAVAVPRPG